MTTAELPIPLKQLLKCSSSELDEQALQLLIGTREEPYLDVKREPYGNGDSDKRELAADVAAFANANGGLLLLGMDEEREVITELTPFVTDGEELRIRQILANVVPPLIAVDVRTIPASGRSGLGYLAITVEKSISGPHAVVKDIDLRFPIRAGTRKRYMSESEIASRYSDRFLQRSELLERARNVHASVQTRLDPTADVAWLVISSMPASPGSLPVRNSSLASARTWWSDFHQTLPDSATRDYGSNFTTGFRHIRIGMSNPEDSSFEKWQTADLYDDGATAIAIQVGHPWRNANSLEDSESSLHTIGDEGLALAVLSAIMTIGAHAARAGAGQDLAVSTSLVSSGMVEVGNTRRHYVSRNHATRSIDRFENQTRSVNAASTMPGPELLQTGFLIASDIVSAFGQAEIQQLTEEGQFDFRFINKDYRPTVRKWASRFSIDVLHDS